MRCCAFAAMLKLWITMFLLEAFPRASPSPYLFSAPRALAGLATSASASASGPKPEALTNVLDLRRKQQKSAQLQAEKYSTEEDMLLLHEQQNNSAEESANEASPGIVHKKVSKILTKLKLIAQFKNAVHQDEEKKEEIKRNDDEFEKKLAKFDEELEDDMKKGEAKESNPHIQNLKKDADAGYTYSPVQDVPEKVYLKLDERGEPEEVDIEIEKKVGRRSEKQVNGRFGEIGIFFTELLGTLLTLAYGVAIQATGGREDNL